MPSFTRVAGGNIKPYRFVKIVGVAGGGQVLQAAANTDEIYGISQPGTHTVPGTIGLDDGFAATQGENVTIFGPPEKDVLLKLGSSTTCVEGDRFESDSDGAGVVSTTNSREIGAVAMETQSVAGGLVKVQCVGYRY